MMQHSKFNITNSAVNNNTFSLIRRNAAIYYL